MLPQAPLPMLGIGAWVPVSMMTNFRASLFILCLASELQCETCASYFVCVDQKARESTGLAREIG